MEDSYESAAALVCTIRGATAEHLVAFVGSLIGQLDSVKQEVRFTDKHLGRSAEVIAGG
jgi:hypothetical protein